MKLQELYQKQVMPALKKELGLKNDWAVPRLRAVKVNVGLGMVIKKSKDFADITASVAKITGQKPIVTKAKKAISNFKLRQGQPVALVVTLRGKRMYDFLGRLINVAIPRVRDFRGLSPKAFDGQGNCSIGLREVLVFPEVSPDDLLNVHGLQVTVMTTAKTNERGLALLKALGFPFKTPTPPAAAPTILKS